MKMRALSEKARRASLWTDMSSPSWDSFSFTTRRTIVLGSSSASDITFWFSLSISVSILMRFLILFFLGFVVSLPPLALSLGPLLLWELSCWAWSVVNNNSLGEAPSEKIQLDSQFFLLIIPFKIFNFCAKYVIS